MKKVIGIGVKDYRTLIEKDYFYIDKTDMIREWWAGGDYVTLINRPRRFGKTLNLSMIDYFFSNKFPGRSDLFENQSVWKYEALRKEQGSWPVISISFAKVKDNNYNDMVETICFIIQKLYHQNIFLLEKDCLAEPEKRIYQRLCDEMPPQYAKLAILNLSDYLSRYYGKNVIILLDEYDTPMQEAYVGGYWDEAVSFIRSLFNATFKDNPFLERGLITGITRISKESVFSDLNNLKVITTTSSGYETSFGFTEDEVFAAMEQQGYIDEETKAGVKKWYDGFNFGTHTDIYNPWSIINFLDNGRFETYWANSSANSLIRMRLQKGSGMIKEVLSDLIQGGTLTVELDEEIVYNRLDMNEEAIWSLMLASGYLKVVDAAPLKPERENEYPICTLAVTNLEVQFMLRGTVREWFAKAKSYYNDFIGALLDNDRKAMNAYMNRVALRTISYFDSGTHPSDDAPERFYHGFVLGLLVDLRDRYEVKSNRESGFGRYDIMLIPKEPYHSGYIIEFKVLDPEEEKTLTDTAKAALTQIDKKQYEQELLAMGILAENIHKYGFAFEGKKVLILGG